MKSIFPLALLFIGLTAFSPLHDGPHELEIGAAAKGTDLPLTTTEGKSVHLTDLKKGNGLLVIFSCNTCPFVLKWENRYNGLAKLSGEKNVGMVVVNSNEAKREGDDSLEAMKTHAEKESYHFPYVLDEGSKLADALGGSRTPHVFLFDKDMKLVYRGAIDDNADDKNAVTHAWLDDAINHLAAGEKIDPSTTRSLGCTIKRLPQ
ncbi:MAG: thioredoxin family protein [Flavobacteriales bacterium]|nr:thioredoxin family protein [Flavobacteriales bacterium]MCB9449780.1 thioredoxin family protein [Flavobacteriales bacterium]